MSLSFKMMCSVGVRISTSTRAIKLLFESLCIIFCVLLLTLLNVFGGVFVLLFPMFFNVLDIVSMILLDVFNVVSIPLLLVFFDVFNVVLPILLLLFFVFVLIFLISSSWNYFIQSSLELFQPVAFSCV